MALGGDVMDVLRDEKRASRQLSAQNNAKSSHHWQIFGSIWVGALFAHICGSAQDGAHEALHASIHSLKDPRNSNTSALQFQKLHWPPAAGFTVGLLGGQRLLRTFSADVEKP